MVTEDDPAKQYLDLLYCYLYAQGQGGDLRIYDHSNPVSPFQGFFTGAFEDVPGLKYIDARDLKSKMLHEKPGTYMPFVRTLSVDTLREAADTFFRLKPAKLLEVEAAHRNLGVVTFSKEAPQLAIPSGSVPTVFDCGVYIKGGAKAVAPYLAMIKALQIKMRADWMNIFVLVEDEAVYKELAAGADSSWTYYTVIPRPVPISRSPRLATRSRLENYTQFLAEIATLQNTPNLICPLQSAIGKFVYLTCLAPENFKAVDGGRFEA